MKENVLQKSIQAGSGKIFKELYVSPSGDDGNPGTLAEPLQSLAGARDRVRSLNRAMDGDIVVYLRGGRYQQARTLDFTEKDSGRNGCSIIYKAYGAEKPVLSGGLQVTGWRKVRSEAKGSLWQAAVPELEDSANLFVNGSSAVRARGPVKATAAWDVVKGGEFEFYGVVEKFPGHNKEITVYEGYKTTNAVLADWQNPEDLVFVYDVGWTHSVCPVEEIVRAGDGAIIKMRMPCFRDCQVKAGVQIGGPSYIENALELLDEPGEWYFNRKIRMLYYMTPPEEDLNEQETIVPQLEKFMEIRGLPSRPVANLQFHQLTFEHTTFLRPSRSGHAEIQANLIKDPASDSGSAYLLTPSAIVIEAGEAIVFHRCTFSRLGSGAVDLLKGSRNNLILGCKFCQIGASGIQLGGFLMQDAHPDDAKHIVRDNWISNNYFDQIGTEFKGSVAVTAGYSQGTVITHNEIRHVAYSGISVGWGWGNWDVGAHEDNFSKPADSTPCFKVPTIASHNAIEYNHIHRVMEKLHDGGGIYTLSMQAGSTIIGNLIHDTGEYSGGGYKGDVLIGGGGVNEEERARARKIKGYPGGIYLDEASGGFEVTGNIVYHVVVPIYYHLTVKDRDKTNQFHDNYCHLQPGDEGYPTALAAKAGLEEEFSDLVLGWNS